MMKVEQALIRPVYDDILDVATAALPWERLKNKTVLITGGAGFIGFYLTTALLIRNDLYGDNINVIALVRNNKKCDERFGDLLMREDLTIVVQDVCDEIKIKQKADFIIHAASQASAYFFEHDPVGTIDANLTGTTRVLEYAEKCKAEATLIISSLKVYGALHNGKDSISEDDIGYIDHTNYKNCYAVGKRASEALCACYCRQKNLSVKIARPSYIYGPSSLDDDRVWAQFIANVVKGEDILLKSNGAAMRSFCYVSDTAEALFTILLCGADIYPYNISSEYSNVTIRDFAKAAVETFPEKMMKLKFQNPEDEKEPQRSYLGATPEILDNKRLKDLGWVGRTTLKDGIAKSVRIVSAQNGFDGV